MPEIIYEKDGIRHKIAASDDNVTVMKSIRPERVSIRLVPKNEVVLVSVRYEFPYRFHENDRVFLNGYQSWTACEETGIHEKRQDMRFCPEVLNKKYAFDRYADGSFYHASRKRGVSHGYSYGYVRRGNLFSLFGSLSEQTGFTRFVFDCDNSRITVEKDCAGRVLKEEYEALSYAVYSGSEKEVFDAWFEELSITALEKEPVRGYTSWYNYYQEISEELILKDLEGLKALPEKPQVFQIDDGFETYVGDWLSVNQKKFPGGLKETAERIRKDGYVPGLWLAPFVAEKDSELVKNHPDWLVYDGTEPLVAGGNWSGVYVLDFYREEVREYIRTCIETVVSEWGFELLKLDFLYAVCLKPTKEKTRGEIMDEAMTFLREICGKAKILACGVPLASAFGKVDYCRIGADVSLEWDGPLYLRPFHKERPSTKNTMRNTIYRRQLSGRAFLNDPDVFILRTDHVSMTKEQKLALGTVNGLFGAVLFASDDFSKYTEEEKKWYLYFDSLKNAEVLDISNNGKTITIRYRVNGIEKQIMFR